jgi:rhodanese-related sulfurtransferase
MIARMNDVETVPASEWSEWVERRDGIVLDVREPREWEMGTLPDALRISMTDLVARMDELPRDRAILCVCRSGSRSHQVARFLTLSGFEDVANMGGGMKALGMQE